MYKYLLLAAMLGLGACSKSKIDQPAETPVIDYTDLNKEVPFNSSFLIDLDNNGSKDFLFYTELVGDPILKRDYRQFHIGSSYAASVLVDTTNEETPVLSQNTAISPDMKGNRAWFNTSDVVLTRKVIGMSGSPFWEGGWQKASHQFVAVRVTRASGDYYGWLEISFDTAAEKIILHRGALCREAGKTVKAGV